MGFRSRNAAKDHLLALERKGYIERRLDQSRGIRLIDARPERSLPLVGRVAAGEPLLAVEHIESWPACDPAVFSPRADYLLRVQGWSMRDAGIADGDLLAVHSTPTARSGEIVVARLDDEVTVKTFRQQGERIWLEPANPAFSPMVVDPRQHTFAIEGRMVGLIRPQVAAEAGGEGWEDGR